MSKEILTKVDMIKDIILNSTNTMLEIKNELDKETADEKETAGEEGKEQSGNTMDEEEPPAGEDKEEKGEDYQLPGNFPRNKIPGSLAIGDTQIS